MWFSSTKHRQTWIGLAFTLPWLVGFSGLIVYPFVASLVWSFCRYDLLSPPRFVGVANYERLLVELRSGEGFAQALWNTVYYAGVSVPLSIILGVALASMLSWQVRGQAVYRTLIFLPSVIPVVASSVLWLALLDPQDGLVNRWLALLGLAPQPWFNGIAEAAWLPHWWRGEGGFGSKDGLILMSLWGVGNSMIIYLAAIGDIPRHLYEAAELDGAGRWRRFWHITRPMLSPVIFFNLVLGLIQAVQTFTQVYIVSEGTGAPAGASLVLSLHLFLSAFKDLDMGYASAMAWALFVVVLLATWALFRSTRYWVHYRSVR